MQPQVAADLYALLSGTTASQLKGKLYADGDIPQGTALPYAWYSERQNVRNNTTHDRQEGSHGASKISFTIAAASVREAREIMRATLAGAQCSGYQSVRRLALSNEADGMAEIPGQEQPIHVVVAEFSVLYRIQ